jgi:uncharacterized protein (DUF1778 family)
MPRAAARNLARLDLRIRPADRARLMRAVALEGADMRDFVLTHALRAADDAIERSQRIKLSARSAKVLLDMLDNPPKPNARMIKAAKALMARR